MTSVHLWSTFLKPDVFFLFLSINLSTKSTASTDFASLANVVVKRLQLILKRLFWHLF